MGGSNLTRLFIEIFAAILLQQNEQQNVQHKNLIEDCFLPVVLAHKILSVLHVVRRKDVNQPSCRRGFIKVKICSSSVLKCLKINVVLC